MRAFCQCGHLFTVRATDFPHQINCHVCGYKFLVEQDGRTYECEGPVRKFEVACACGQSFHIQSDHFPRQTHCHVCGNRFTVFGDGRTQGVELPDGGIRAFCKCGHLFTVHATHFPHQINCHICDYSFLVQEDGRTHECNGPVREFDVACTCGQSFHIQSAHFPRHVQCHACGNRFTVFDDGNTLSIELPDDDAPIDPSAIQDDRRRIRPDVDAPIRLIDAAAVAKKEDSLAELRLVDLQWEVERMQFTGICRFLRSLCTLRGFVFGGLGSLVVIALCLVSTYLFDIPVGVAIFIRVSWYLVAIAGVVMSFFVREMREYDKAELAWQRRRVVVMAKAGVSIETITAAVKVE